MDRITLTYELSNLPTAQQKAGLAGLVLSIREMRENDRRIGNGALKDEDIPEMGEVTDTGVTITLTERSCQKLFDDCYHSIMGTVEVKKLWKNAEVLRTFVKQVKEDKSEATKDVTYYVHPNLEPCNPFLKRHLFVHSELWYKLWRDMLFEIPRAKPTTRNPYKETVVGSCREGAKMWSELLRFEKARAKNQVRTSTLSSSLFLGAQNSTAENVAFSERTDNILLLHFWPITTLIYVPFLLDVDAAKPDRSQAKATGYSLAIPDIANLKSFCRNFPLVLKDLGANAKAQRHRPRNACVDVAGQAALDTLTQQAWLAGEKTKDLGKLVRMIHAVEYIHLERQRNNVKTLGSGRVAPEDNLLRRYERLVNRYRSPLFRSLRLRSFFGNSDTAWWQGFEKPLSTLPHEILLAGKNLPMIARLFCNDVRLAFQEDESTLNPLENSMSETAELPDNGTENLGKSPKSVEKIILNLVRGYVIQTTESKTKVAYKTIKAEFEAQSKAAKSGDESPGNSPQKNKFEEERAKLASRLFLAARSRHGEDFKAWFAEHFGAAQQRSIAAAADFQKLCDSLLKEPDNVRVITLLALSANS